MKCREARDLIVLDRERTQEEAERLKEHLRTCETCPAEFALTMRMRSMIDSVASVTPVLPDPESVTSGILTAVSQLRRRRKSVFLDQCVAVTSHRVFRFTYAFLVVVSVSLYGLLEFRSFAGLSRLEQRMGREAFSEPPRISYAIQQKSLAAVLPHDVIERFSGSSGETVTIDRRLLDRGRVRMGRSGLWPARLPSEIADYRSITEAIDVLGKAVFPKIILVQRSPEQP